MMNKTKAWVLVLVMFTYAAVAGIISAAVVMISNGHPLFTLLPVSALYAYIVKEIVNS